MVRTGKKWQEMVGLGVYFFILYSLFLVRYYLWCRDMMMWKFGNLEMRQFGNYLFASWCLNVLVMLTSLFSIPCSLFDIKWCGDVMMWKFGNEAIWKLPVCLSHRFVSHESEWGKMPVVISWRHEPMHMEALFNSAFIIHHL